MTTGFYTDFRLGDSVRYYLADKEDKMFIPDEIRKSVVFLMYRNKHNSLRFAGTGFFVAIKAGEPGTFFNNLVTVKHVIVEIKKRSIDNLVYIRINDNNGGFQIIESPIEKWEGHPEDTSVDVSVLRCAFPRDVFDYRILRESYFATDAVIERWKIGIGFDVFVAGLFVGHSGKARNTPIIRAGNIAAMPEEKVDTKNFGSIDAYLVESRSIGGLSGSPVFVNVGGFYPKEKDEEVGFLTNANIGKFYLLGLMHGHWDRDENTIDSIEEDVDGGKVNMGIAIVVPATKILEILFQPKWVEEREKIMEKEKSLPTEDATDDENGVFTQDDMENALKKAFKPDEKKKSGEEKSGT